MEFKISKKPAKTDGEGDKRFGKAHRQFLAEIVKGKEVVDSAYFKTQAEAEDWVRNAYKLL